MKNISEDASDEMIREAVASLTSKQILQLESLAERKLMGVTVRAVDGRDLLQQAIEKTLSRARRWPFKKIDFFTHLRMSIQSIASNWRAKARFEFSLDDSSIDYRDRAQSIEKELLARELLSQLRASLHGDITALKILDALDDGMSKREEIRDELAITDLEYAAAKKRLVRKLKKVSSAQQGSGAAAEINSPDSADDTPDYVNRERSTAMR